MILISENLLEDVSKNFLLEPSLFGGKVTKIVLLLT